MKRALPVLIGLVAALAVGYIVGYSRGRSPSPLVQSQSSGTNSRWERFVEDVRDEDQMTTSLSLYSLRRLDRGEIEPTKEFLASRIAYFYLSYGPADHPRKQLDDTGERLLQAIYDFSQTNAILQAALKRRAEEFAK